MTRISRFRHESWLSRTHEAEPSTTEPDPTDAVYGVPPPFDSFPLDDSDSSQPPPSPASRQFTSSTSFTFTPDPHAPEFVPRATYVSQPSLPVLGPKSRRLVPLDSHPVTEDPDPSVEVGARSWAQVVNPEAMAELPVADAESQLCPFNMIGECHYGESCAYIHGDTCDYCGQDVLHPLHEGQRREHHAVSIRRNLVMLDAVSKRIVPPLDMYAIARRGHGSVLCRGSFQRQNLWYLHGDGPRQK